jgi:hypothetical protein
MTRTMTLHVLSPRFDRAITDSQPTAAGPTLPLALDKCEWDLGGISEFEVFIYLC